MRKTFKADDVTWRTLLRMHKQLNFFSMFAFSEFSPGKLNSVFSNDGDSEGSD